MLSGGLAEILCRVAEGGEAVFCIPGPNNCFEPAAHYGIDGVTEKVIYFYIKYRIHIKTQIIFHSIAYGVNSMTLSYPLVHS